MGIDEHLRVELEGYLVHSALNGCRRKRNKSSGRGDE